MNKQIEDMIKAFDDYCNYEVPDEECVRSRCIDCHAKSLIKAGYRKSSEVAMEIFAEIEKCFFEELVGQTEAKLLDDEMFAELRKKYIGADTNVTTKEREGGE